MSELGGMTKGPEPKQPPTLQQQAQFIAERIVTGMGRGRPPTSTDMEFATKFILAMQAFREMPSEF